MDIKLAKTFEFEGKTYEIYIIKDGDRTEVRAYVEGKPANGYFYSASLMVRLGFKEKFGYDPVVDLIEDAESDVRNKTWETYCKAVQQVRR